jgi:hypothetical protein
VVQVAVLWRINARDAGAEHTDRAAPGADGGLVGGGVDPGGKPGNHRDTSLGKAAGDGGRS